MRESETTPGELRRATARVRKRAEKVESAAWSAAMSAERARLDAARERLADRVRAIEAGRTRWPARWAADLDWLAARALEWEARAMVVGSAAEWTAAASCARGALALLDQLLTPGARPEPPMREPGHRVDGSTVRLVRTRTHDVGTGRETARRVAGMATRAAALASDVPRVMQDGRSRAVRSVSLDAAAASLAACSRALAVLYWRDPRSVL